MYQVNYTNQEGTKSETFQFQSLELAKKEIESSIASKYNFFDENSIEWTIWTLDSDGDCIDAIEYGSYSTVSDEDSTELEALSILEYDLRNFFGGKYFTKVGLDCRISDHTQNLNNGKIDVSIVVAKKDPTESRYCESGVQVRIDKAISFDDAKSLCFIAFRKKYEHKSRGMK